MRTLQWALHVQQVLRRNFLEADAKQKFCANKHYISTI